MTETVNKTGMIHRSAGRYKLITVIVSCWLIDRSIVEVSVGRP